MDSAEDRDSAERDGTAPGPAEGAPADPVPLPAGLARALEAPAAEPRFVTWRPGSDAREVPVSPSAPAEDAGEAARAEPDDPLAGFFYRPDEQVPTLLALGPAPARSERPGGAAGGARQEFLAFRLGAETYAVEMARVREVLRAPPVTEVPRAPEGVLGVITVRGDVVAVFDPRHALGLAGAVRPGGRIVIVDGGEGACGLLVDAVESVVRLPAGSLEAPPRGGGLPPDCLVGVGRDRERLFTVLDVAALLRRGGAEGSARDGR